MEHSGIMRHTCGQEYRLRSQIGMSRTNDLIVVHPVSLAKGIDSREVVDIIPYESGRAVAHGYVPEVERRVTGDHWAIQGGDTYEHV